MSQNLEIKKKAKLNNKDKKDIKMQIKRKLT
jgi:hypothetical protein